MKDTWTMPGELSQITRTVEGGDEQTTVALPGEPPAPTPKIDALDKLDFDLDLGGGDESAAGAKPTDESKAIAAAAVPAQTTYVGLDSETSSKGGLGALDFELTTQPHSPLADVAAGREDTNVIDLKATQPNEVAALDFNLDSISTNIGGAGSAFAAPEAPMVDLEKTDAGGSLVNFDFELGDSQHLVLKGYAIDYSSNELRVIKTGFRATSRLRYNYYLNIVVVSNQVIITSQWKITGVIWRVGADPEFLIGTSVIRK